MGHDQVQLGIPGVRGEGQPAFDAHRPPSKELIDDCVHCGFCLTTCPTYNLWGEEMDSPRGRIHLMQAGLEGSPLTDSMVGHFDACLGCMACVTACPSGVQYDRLIEQTRAQVERRHDRTPKEKALRAAIFSLFPYPKRLRLLRGPLRLAQKVGADRALAKTGLLERISPELASMQSLAPQLGKAEKVPERTPAIGERRAVVGMLTGCVQREFFPGVNAATARVLAAEGCEVIAPARQGCCGALSTHVGREEEGQRFARALIDTFSEAAVDYVVVNSAGCGSSMKEYVHLLSDDPAYADRAREFSSRVRDFAEIIAELGPVAPRHPINAVAAYHDACHLGHAQGIRNQPRELLRAIPGLEVREIPDAEICCGSAGVYNILNPEPAKELGDRKAANIASTGAELLITANPGCLMQVANSLERAGKSIGMAHTAVVLDASIRGVPLEA
ncbi:(Fe-S)-binding protein [Ornithinicoccus hortensis]|uniref:Glycolate oxidase iron-sulfur subunit n=1 Tax=Ornithinicoccus hortensis TaxID=82346 RepID=A0A542YSD5_9MICO|nr:heterodisulfide reductase-related iron-sulfur binding cluster [Ornithinicoccus hortensis]TQL50854.1 glycolate oxidase iron-sulfur subunit [Ornithinicoccus hortensis]